MALQIGVRVIRGPDWCHGNEDGGNGFVGTVTEISKNEKTCLVQWDYHGNTTQCGAEGEEGLTELRVIDIQQSGIYFSSITCNACDRSGLAGYRWKCVECNDFDLCTTCYMEDEHDKNHVFVRYESSMTACIPCPARSKSKKTKIFGIGPNAVVTLFPPTADNDQKGRVVQYVNFGKSNCGGVEVDWSGTLSKHKLGVDGKAELIMEEPFQLGTIYADHLPLGDLSCPKPSYINVGDKVQININTDSFRQLNEEFGGWNDEMEKIVGEIGVVQKVMPSNQLMVMFGSGRPWVIYRQACTKISTVSKGDVIKVVEDISFLQRIQSNHGIWLEEMKKLPGKIGKVYNEDTEGLLFVKFPKLGEYLLSPSCCVKLYNPPKLQFDEKEDLGASKSADPGGATAAEPGGKCGMVFDIGIRVVRGQNWSWDNQDGGEGHLGTVVEIGHEESASKVPPMCVQVQWDKGYKNIYRVGYEDQYDLRIFDTSALGIRHDKVCSEPDCEEPEIYGMLWKCEQCPDVTLCSSCYHSDKHDIIHKFTRFDYSGHQGCSVPKRQLSSRQKVFGIFENAKVTRGIDWRWDDQDGGDGSSGTVLAVVNFSLDTDHDGVEVAWDSGHTNVYRLGYKGCVDVKAVESASGGFYYKDHLPVFKLSNQPRPGPSQAEREGVPAEASQDGRLKKGDTVKIGVDLDTLQAVLKESKNWNERIVEFIGVNGKIMLINGQQITVDFDGRKWILPELTLVKVEQYEKDQVVQVENDANHVGRLQNGHGPWDESMKKFLGKRGRVVLVDGDGDVTVSFGKREIKFNPECLRPAKGSVFDEKDEEPQGKHEETREKPHGKQDETREQKQGRQERSFPDVDSVPVESDLSRQQDEPHPTEDEESEEEMDDISDQQDKFMEEIKKGNTKNALQMLQKHPKIAGLTLLSQVCDQDKCDLSLVEALLKHGAKMDEKRTPPLLTAVRRGHVDVVKLLLNKGADPNISNNNKQTAVHIAVQTANKDMLQILKDKCNFNICDKLGDSPVSDAISIGDRDIIDIIFQWPNINLKFENKLGFYPIHLAARKGDLHAVQQILQKCPEAANTQKVDGYTALHLAACMDHSDIAKTLLDKGARSFTQTESEGQTPLHIAALYGSYETARVLIEDGSANVNATDKNGNNALHLCLMRRPAMMEFAKMQKADSGSGDGVQEKEKIAGLLIQHNIQTELKNNENKSPLEVAASPSLGSNVEILIKEKQNPSVRPKKWKCEVCDEEDAAYQMKPCECRLCEDCIPRKLKKCPNCKGAVSNKAQF